MTDHLLPGERQRRERKATVGEVEDGMRNLMRVVKTHLDVQAKAVRDARRAFIIAAVAIVALAITCIVMVVL